MKPRSPAKALILTAAALGVIASPAAAGQPIGDGRGGIGLNRIGSFDQPVHVAGAPGFPRLLFVVEQPGRVKVLANGRKLRRSFLDLTGRINSGGEEGLLSIAFPPDYRRSGRFYVFYTDEAGNLRVDELRRRSATRAAAGSRRTVIVIRHPVNSNHNGGQLAFLGSLLYISTGDGGGGGDEADNAQNRSVLLGKILRIDPRNPRGRRDYRIPRGNPFVGRAGRDEIFSYGLRNPFRFAFDRISARRPRIVIGDVGQDRFEEIDYERLPVANGANFGWDAFEGFAQFEPPFPRGTEKPIFAYGNGCSVISGFVVRDRTLRSLFKRLIYADFCNGDLRSLIPDLRRARGDRALGIHLDAISSFGETPAGRVFVASLDGGVYRLVAR